MKYQKTFFERTEGNFPTGSLKIYDNHHSAYARKSEGLFEPSRRQVFFFLADASIDTQAVFAQSCIRPSTQDSNFANVKIHYEVVTCPDLAKNFFPQIMTRLRAVVVVMVSSLRKSSKGSRASSLLRSVDFDDSTPRTKSLSCQTRCKHRGYSRELSSERTRER